MLRETTILAKGFPTVDEALAPLRSAVPKMKNVNGTIESAESTLECFQPTFGRWGGRFRYEARISAINLDGRFAIVLALERLDARECFALAVSAAFLPVVVSIGRPDLLWEGILLGFFSIGLRAVFLFRGASAVTACFASAFDADGNLPNHTTEPGSPKRAGSP